MTCQTLQRRKANEASRKKQWPLRIRVKETDRQAKALLRLKSGTQDAAARSRIQNTWHPTQVVLRHTPLITSHRMWSLCVVLDSLQIRPLPYQVLRRAR